MVASAKIPSLDDDTDEYSRPVDPRRVMHGRSSSRKVVFERIPKRYFKRKG